MFLKYDIIIQTRRKITIVSTCFNNEYFHSFYTILFCRKLCCFYVQSFWKDFVLAWHCIQLCGCFTLFASRSVGSFSCLDTRLWVKSRGLFCNDLPIFLSEQSQKLPNCIFQRNQTNIGWSQNNLKCPNDLKIKILVQKRWSKMPKSSFAGKAVGPDFKIIGKKIGAGNFGEVYLGKVVTSLFL